jgi:hypothetical protein
MARNDKADASRRNAQGYFNDSQKREQSLRAELEKAQTAEKEKIARLRALRLANENASEGSVATGDETQ